jgi:pimeloyl-ACP methyl ester carboxylesterase
MIHHRIVPTNGIRMHIAEAGTGPLVLLCHGWPESWYSWRHQLKALAEAGYHAVAPDQRGYGQTDRPEAIDQYTLLHLVGDLVGLVAALGERNAVIVGHDWGAPVAWTSALLRPDMFRGVAGLSVPYLPRGPGRPIEALKQFFGDRFFYQLYFQQPNVPEAELERDIRTTMRRVLCGASAEYAGRRDPERMAAARCFLETMPEPESLAGWLSEADLDVFTGEFQRGGFRGSLNWYRNIDRNWELLAPFAGLPVQPPALFLAGQQDPVLGFPGFRAAVEHMGQVVPNLRRVVLLDDCGHWIQQEKPAETNAALIDFLQGLGDGFKRPAPEGM